MPSSDSLSPSYPRAAIDERAEAVSRALRQLADSWEQAFAARSDAASQALAPWRGPEADRFAESISAETSHSAHVVARLRSEADRWASASVTGVDIAGPWSSIGLPR